MSTTVLLELLAAAFLTLVCASPALPETYSASAASPSGTYAYSGFRQAPAPLAELLRAAQASHDAARADAAGGVPTVSGRPPSGHRRSEQQFLPPPDSVVPKLVSGWMAEERRVAQQPKAGEAGEAVIDPAAFYMMGANLDKVPPPKCQLVGCTGPLANDGDIAFEGPTGSAASAGGVARQCHQTFVPLNGCFAEDGRGYPVGMVCTLCCECSAQLGDELRRSRGWASGYRSTTSLGGAGQS